MALEEGAGIKARIQKIKQLSDGGRSTVEYFEAASLARTVLYDTSGGSHPLMGDLDSALRDSDWARAVGASRAVLTLYDQGGLVSPRLTIAHEIEGDLLSIAQMQLEAGERSQVAAEKQLRLAVAGFLAGASLEDALRRLCTAGGISFDMQQASIGKLQSELFQPSKGVEVISSSENKQITAWGDTRNKADHGKFGEITYAEVLSMVVGVRAFIDRHLP